MNRTVRVALSSRFFGEYLRADAGARLLRNEVVRIRRPEQS